MYLFGPSDRSVRMERKERTINLYLLLILPFGLASIAWAITWFRRETFDARLVILALAMIFLNSFLRIQLPRNNVPPTISKALIMMSMLIYGAEIAVFLAVCETAYTSVHFRHKGVPIRPRIVIFNMMIAGITVFAADRAVRVVFGSAKLVFPGLETVVLISLLIMIAFSMFLVNTLLVVPFLAMRGEKSLSQVLKEYWPDVLAVHLLGAVMAGLMLKALEQINMYVFASIMGFFALVYWTYRRNVDDVKNTAAAAQHAEHQRAEQAEKHISQLEHYVAEMERTSGDLRESRELFRHAAYHDELTGLPNRNQIIDSIREHIEKKKNDSRHNFAVLFLDLNRFKTINDSLGHATGDLLIKHVARRLKEILTSTQMVGRFSGDEFAILITQFSDAREVTELASKVARRLAEPFRLGDRRVFTSVGVGIAFGNRDYIEPLEILRDSDIAMYYAKENHKNFVIFDQKMHARAVTLLQLETDLRLAIERGELEIFYQPIIGLADTKLAGFEALLRWNHPTRGLISPSEFIPLSEDTALIIPMTLQVLKTACLQLVDWQRRFASDDTLTISVNLSGKHFAYPDLVQQIKTILKQTRISPECLKLEITESAVMANAENAIVMLKQIRETGVQVSIDDFGTGHSSLSYLQRFPVDTLKIDRSFVSAMEDGSENGEIVRTVLALAKILKLNVVAEGIESIHQFHQLRILGCEYGQGYLFSRPLPAQEIEKKMQKDKFQWEDILPMQEFATRDREYELKELTAIH